MCSQHDHEVGPEAGPGAAMAHFCKILQQINLAENREKPTFETL